MEDMQQRAPSVFSCGQVQAIRYKSFNWLPPTISALFYDSILLETVD